ncbi:hypothetical protein COBT_002196 [Conglomerata obtusa]
MKNDELKQAAKLISSIVTLSKIPTYPHISKKGCINALKKIFEKSSINNIVNYIKAETSDRRKITELEFNLKNNFQDLFSIRDKELDYVRGEKDINVGKNKKLNKNLNFVKNKIENKFYPYKDPFYKYYSAYSITGHSAYVSCVVIMGDDVMITAAEDKSIKIWNIRKGMLIRTLIKHEFYISDISISMDNEFLVSCDSGGIMIVWDLKTFEIVHVLEMNGVVELVEFIKKEDDNFNDIENLYKKKSDLARNDNNTIINMEDYKSCVLYNLSETYISSLNDPIKNDFIEIGIQDPENLGSKQNKITLNDNANQLNCNCINDDMKDCLNEIKIIENNLEMKFLGEENSTSQKINNNNLNSDFIDDIIPNLNNYASKNTKKILKYTIIAVLSRGVVNSISFDANTITNTSENDIMASLGDEGTICAICISEGGRFLFTGGMWPFLLVFDTYNFKNNIFTLETDGHSILSICASKNKSLFAASTNFNFLYEWEYVETGTNRCCNVKNTLFKKKETPGFWSKRIIYITEEENVSCERLEYLCDGSLVCVCSDDKIRIAGNDIDEIRVSDTEILNAHPLLPFFAISGIFNEAYEEDVKRFHVFEHEIDKNAISDQSDFKNRHIKKCNKNNDLCKNQNGFQNFYNNENDVKRDERHNNDETNFYMHKTNVYSTSGYNAEKNDINQVFNDNYANDEKKKLFNYLFNEKPTKPIELIKGINTNEELSARSSNKHCIRFYTNDLKLISSFDIFYRLTDSNFSSSGKYFSTVDETGKIKVYDLHPFSKQYNLIPTEQFFKCELNEMYGYLNDDEKYDATYSLSGEPNINWKSYKIDLSNSFKEQKEKNTLFAKEIERQAMDHIKDKFYTFEKFHEKYIVDESKKCHKVDDDIKEESSSSIDNFEASMMDSIISSESYVVKKKKESFTRNNDRRKIIYDDLSSSITKTESYESTTNVKRRKAAVIASKQLKNIVKEVNNNKDLKKSSFGSGSSFTDDESTTQSFKNILNDKKYDKKYKNKEMNKKRSKSPAIENSSDVKNINKKNNSLIMDFLRTPNKVYDHKAVRKTAVKANKRQTIFNSSDYSNDSFNTKNSLTKNESFNKKNNLLENKLKKNVKNISEKRNITKKTHNSSYFDENSDRNERSKNFSDTNVKESSLDVGSSSIDNIKMIKFPKRRASNIYYREIKIDNKCDEKKKEVFTEKKYFNTKNNKISSSKDNPDQTKTSFKSDESLVIFPRRRNLSINNITRVCNEVASSSKKSINNTEENLLQKYSRKNKIQNKKNENSNSFSFEDKNCSRKETNKQRKITETTKSNFRTADNIKLDNISLNLVDKDFSSIKNNDFKINKITNDYFSTVKFPVRRKNESFNKIIEKYVKNYNESKNEDFALNESSIITFPPKRKSSESVSKSNSDVFK